MLEIGTFAPDFTLPDQEGEEVALLSLRGKWIALWWYSMANTFG